jgi:hypothetical protein
VIGIFRTKTNTGSIVEPESSSLGLLLWNLKTFFSPDSIDPIFPDIESIHIQKPCHFTIAVSAKKFGKINHSFPELFSNGIDFILISLCATIKPNNFTGPTFGNIELVYDVINGILLASRA